MSETITVYTSAELAEAWKQAANRRDMSVSKFVQDMTEAGRKEISVEFQIDNDAAELRHQRNNLKRENEELQRRIERLQKKALNEEREFIIEFIQDNPGATYRTIVEGFIDTAPSRVNYYLDVLTGDEIEKEGNHYYSTDSSQKGGN